jgi:hypothetical protein
LADKLIELIEVDCNSICPPSQRAGEIAKLEAEIDQLVRIDVVLCDADGQVHDEHCTPAALLMVQEAAA